MTGAAGEHLTHFHAAIGLRERRLWEDALRELERGAAAGEDPAMLAEARAEVLLALGRSEAGAAYRALLETDPSRPKLWNELGVAHHRAGRLDEADGCYGEALSLDVGYALAWNNRGVLALGRGQTEHAERAFAHAVRLHPGLIVGWCNRGLLALRAGRHREALHAYRAALDEDLAAAAAWTGVGMVLAEMRRFPESRNALAQAVEHDPRAAAARYHLAFVLARLGDNEGSRRETRRAVELDPDFREPGLRLAIEMACELAEEPHPPSPATPAEDELLLRAAAERAQGRALDAVATLTELLARETDHLEALLALAGALAEAGRDDDARRALERAARVHPGSGKARERLRRLAEGG